MLLFRCLAGSRLYGVDDENSDLDLDEVHLPSVEDMCGLGSIQRPKFSKSALGDSGTEVTVYQLQQYAHLIYKGNFKVLETLFAPPTKQLFVHNWFRPFIDRRQEFLDHRIITPMLRFAESNIRGIDKEPTPNSSRHKLFLSHGYDTKYSAHSIRVLEVCIHYLDTGHFVVEVDAGQRHRFLQIKHGEYAKNDVIAIIEFLKSEVDKRLQLKVSNSSDELVENLTEDRIFGALQGLTCSLAVRSIVADKHSYLSYGCD